MQMCSERARTRVYLHSSTDVAAEIADSTSWLKIWDLALDYGPCGTSAIQALFKTMTRPVFGSASCGFCENSVTATYLEHSLSCQSQPIVQG